MSKQSHTISLFDTDVRSRGVSNDVHDDIQHQENTPAYEILQKHGLLVTKYRKTNFEDLFESHDLLPNSSHSKNLTKRCTWGVYAVPLLGAAIYNTFHTEVRAWPIHAALLTAPLCELSKVPPYLCSHIYW